MVADIMCEQPLRFVVFFFFFFILVEVAQEKAAQNATEPLSGTVSPSVSTTYCSLLTGQTLITTKTVSKTETSPIRQKQERFVKSTNI